MAIPTNKELRIYHYNAGGAGTESSYSFAAVLDGWKSLIIYENYYTCDTFELVIPISEENIANFKVKNLILFDNEFYYIDDVSSTLTDESDSITAEITVRGNSLLGYYAIRMIFGSLNCNLAPDNIVYNLLRDNLINSDSVSASPSGGMGTDEYPAYPGSYRNFPFLSLPEYQSLNLPNISYSAAYKTIQEEVENLCQTYDFGFNESAISTQSPVQQINIFKGNDLTNKIIFSDSVKRTEDLTNISYENNNFDERTIAMVQGNNSTGKIVFQGDQISSGIEWKETFVDGTDVDFLDTDTLTTYLPKLQTRGLVELSNDLEVQTIDGEFTLNSKLFQFKKDFFVGDRVTLISDTFQVSKSCVITQAQHSYDYQYGETVKFIFDKQTPEIYKFLK